MARNGFILALVIALSCLIPAQARAALSSQDAAAATISRMFSGKDSLEARQYRLPESRVAGQESVRQSVTVWEVTAGTWSGQRLQGLSLVLIKNTPDNSSSRPVTNCYVSHTATAAQREALINAYITTQSLSPRDITSWRVEPAVIRIELTGQSIIVHLGLVA